MIYSPLEQFEIVSMISLIMTIINSFNFTITNLGLYTIISVFIATGLHFNGFNDFQIIPSRWTISIESMFDSIRSMVNGQIGQANEIYLPFIYSLFCFILISNLNGNVPYGFTITTSFCVSMGLSVMIFLGVTIKGMHKHEVHFFSYFLPSGTPMMLVPLLVPIEFISYFSRAFSLGIRLFANMVSGHTLLKILSGFLYPMFTKNLMMAIITFLPFSIFTCLVGLEIAVSFIQAYVFTILTSSYIKDAIELH